MTPRNIHATALLVSDRGILITGASGSGKTTLALALIARFAAPGRLCRLVGDDQLFVSARGGRLVCRAPETTAGLVEVFGIGPQPVATERAMVADLVLNLVAIAEAERFQPDAIDTLAGCIVPRVDLAERSVDAALPVVAARLGLKPFV